MSLLSNLYWIPSTTAALVFFLLLGFIVILLICIGACLPRIWSTLLRNWYESHSCRMR